MGRVQISEKCDKLIVPIGSVSGWFLQQGSLNIPYVLNWIQIRVYTRLLGQRFGSSYLVVWSREHLWWARANWADQKVLLGHGQLPSRSRPHINAPKPLDHSWVVSMSSDTSVSMQANRTFPVRDQTTRALHWFNRPSHQVLCFRDEQDIHDFWTEDVLLPTLHEAISKRTISMNRLRTWWWNSALKCHKTGPDDNEYGQERNDNKQLVRLCQSSKDHRVSDMCLPLWDWKGGN